MKKKLLLSIVAFMMAAMMSVGFVSCGGSDGDDSPNEPSPAVTSAKIGDIYYSDGTSSSSLSPGKTPIGIVVYVGNDGASENMHGLVMALRNSGALHDYSDLYPNDRNLFPIVSTASEALSDFKGTEKTKWLADNNSFVAKNAIEYSVQTPSGTTGWFIPSIGQWLAVINKFGAGITKDWDMKNYSGIKFLTNINSALAKVGTDGVDYESISSKNGTGQLGYFYSSSYGPRFSSKTGEQTGYCFYYIVFNDEQGVYSKTSYLSNTSFYIRPFLAF